MRQRHPHALVLLVVTHVHAAPRPNLLLFQPDDLFFFWDDATLYPPRLSKPRVPTPWLDRIRSEGAVFTRAYASAPACAPSRFSVLTGRYPSRSIYGQGATEACGGVSNTMTNVIVENAKLSDSDRHSNLQTSLKAAGYVTGVVGKWHLTPNEQQAFEPPTVYHHQAAIAKATGMECASPHRHWHRQPLRQPTAPARTAYQ